MYRICNVTLIISVFIPFFLILQETDYKEAELASQGNFLEISLIFAGIYFGRFLFSFLSLLSKIDGLACGQYISLGVWSFIALETKIKKSSTPSHTSYVFVVFTHEGRDSGKEHNSQQLKKFIFLNQLKSSYIVWLTINVFLTNC